MRIKKPYKYGLIGVGLFVLFCLVMNKQIIVFYQAQKLPTTNPSSILTPGGTLTLDAPENEQEFIDFKTIQIPLLLSKRERTSSVNLFAFADEEISTRYYLATIGTDFSNSFKNTDFCRNNDESTSFCTNNYEALKKILEITPNDVKFFRSDQAVILSSIKLKLKTQLLTDQSEIIPFVNQAGIKGFILESDDITPVILVDKSDILYELAFSEMTTEEMRTVLANLKEVE